MSKRSPTSTKPLHELQQKVDGWIKTVGVRYFDPLTNMALLTEEVGEVARVMARTYGEQSKKKGEVQDLGEELGDVLFVVLCLANQTGTDLQAAFDKKFVKRTERDAQRHKRNTKLR
ncbi:MAG: nucleotide pyrophosphohydrolase [Flavobacteriales bacterium]